MKPKHLPSHANRESAAFIPSHWRITRRSAVAAASLLLLACIPSLHAQTFSLSNIFAITNGTPGANIGTGDNNRGMAYNALSNQVVVVNKGVPAIDVFDASNGAFVGNIEVSFTAGGNFRIDQVGVADDGVIYACNLQTAPSGSAVFKLYRWGSWNDTAQVVSFSGDPTYGFPASGQRRIGDSMAVTGSGTNTIILASLVGSGGSPATTNVVLFSTADGTNFNPTVVGISGFPTLTQGPFVGLSFYTNNTFLFKPPTSSANSIYLVQFPVDFGATQSVSATVIGTNSIPNGNGNIAISYSPAGKLLATANLTSGGSSTIGLYTVPTFGALTQVATTNYPTPNANGNLTGGAALAGAGKTNSIFALDTNNGLQKSLINFTAQAVAPMITTQPVGGTVYTNIPSFTFNVVASGSVPFSYQWLYSASGTPGTFTAIPSATSSSYTLNFPPVAASGYYSVVITNIGGSVTSAAPRLIVITPLTSPSVTQRWAKAVGSLPYLLASDYGTRGIAYEANSNTVLVASHSGGTGIYLLDGDTGADLGALNTLGLFSGGTFVVDQVVASDDGMVYAANLAVSGQQLSITGWPNADTNAFPFQAFGPADIGSGDRWGDTMAIRGAGADIQIIMGSSSGANALLFTTFDGFSLLPQVINITNAPAGFAGLGITFGRGNTFWAKSAGYDLRLIEYDPGTLTGGVIRDYAAGSQITSSLCGIGVDVTNGILAGIVFSDSPNDLQLFQLSGNTNPPALYDQRFFPSFNANAQDNSRAEIKAGRVYAVNANNGIIALSYGLPLPPAPRIVDFKIQAGTGATVTWTSFNDKMYQLQKRASLNGGSWTDVGAPIKATDALTSATDSSPGAGPGFYRIRAY